MPICRKRLASALKRTLKHGRHFRARSAPGDQDVNIATVDDLFEYTPL
jgi:hypothetical protein